MKRQCLRASLLTAWLLATIGCASAVPTSVPTVGTPPPTAIKSVGAPRTPAATGQSTGPPSLESWIVYQNVGSAGTELRLVRPDGADDHAIDVSELSGADVGHPSWASDASRIFFDQYFDQPGGGDQRVEIWSMEPDGDDPNRIAACELPCLQLAYPMTSPDGSLIAIARYDINSDGTWGPSAIEVLDHATGDRRVVAATTDGMTSYYTPRWSPSGDRLVFVVETYPTEEQTSRSSSTIAVAPLTGIGTDAPTFVTTDALFADAPTWGPDDSILFAASDSESTFLSTAQIYQVGLTGSEPVALTDTESSAGIAIEPAWFSDTNQIAFVRATIGHATLAFVDPGSQSVEVAPWSFVSPPEDIRRTHFNRRPGPT